MKETPILFTTEMIRAIEEGIKTETRRLIKRAHHPADGSPAASVERDGSGLGWVAWWPNPVGAEETRRLYPGEEGFKCPYGLKGDLLWARETWAVAPTLNDIKPSDLPKDTEVFYKAIYDGSPTHLWWRSPRFMPKWAARLWFVNTADHEPQQLQKITPEQAVAEGVAPLDYFRATGYSEFKNAEARIIEAFRELWDSINAKRGYSWASNPWVWRIQFERET